MVPGTFYFLQSLHWTFLFIYFNSPLFSDSLLIASQILWLIHDFRSIPIHIRGLFSMKHSIVSSAMKLTSQASCNNVKSFYKIISKLFEYLKPIFKPFLSYPLIYFTYLQMFLQVHFSFLNVLITNSDILQTEWVTFSPHSSN